MEHKDSLGVRDNGTAREVSDKEALLGDDELAQRRPSSAMSTSIVPPAKPPAKSTAWNFAWIAVNTVSTVVTVFLNKMAFSDPQLSKCQILIAIYHFMATFTILVVSSGRPFRLFTAARAPFRSILPLCLLFAGFLVLNNLSLTFNTVGFYQLSKVMTTPAVILFNFLLFRKGITTDVLAAVLISCFGVALTNYSGISSNVIGASIAVSAFSVTALYQIWIGRKLQDLQMSAPALLLNQTPVASFLLMFLVPFLDTIPDPSKIPSKALLALFLSGFSASMINLSQFCIIEGTSALTFNVASSIKTISIMSLGWYIESFIPSFKDVAGVVLAVGGACAYAQLLARRKGSS